MEVVMRDAPDAGDKYMPLIFAVLTAVTVYVWLGGF